MIGAQDTIEDRPWLTLFPAGMVVLTVLAVSLLGDALRDALDPAGDRVPARRRWAP
jgi:ABC-type dipeptide/oligopeptide/nickel transport system permease subunit